MAGQREAEGESSYTFNASALLVTSDTAVDLLADRRRRGTQVLMQPQMAFKSQSYSGAQSPDVRHDARGSSLVNVLSAEVTSQPKMQNGS